MESLRGGGLLPPPPWTAGGLFLTFILSKGPTGSACALALAPLVIAMLASWSPVQEDGSWGTCQPRPFHHAGHVLTPGFSYQLVDPRYYAERVQLLRSMPPVDAGQFAVKAMWSYSRRAAGVEDRVAAGGGVPAGAVRLVSDDAACCRSACWPASRRDLLLTSMLVSHATGRHRCGRLDQRQLIRHADPAPGAGAAGPWSGCPRWGPRNACASWWAVIVFAWEGAVLMAIC